MITGFNTDIEYNGITYHVQTEDKGLDTPLILSLVYNRGTILASKRSPYNDLLLGEFNEKELSERLNRQHKLICAAIRAGRIEDLKQMNAKDQKQVKSIKEKESPKIEVAKTAKASESRPRKLAVTQPELEIKPSAQFVAKVDESPIPTLLRRESKVELPPIQKPQIELPTPNVETKLKPVETKQTPSINKTEEFLDVPIEISDADLIFEDTRELEQPIVLPPEAVEILTDFSDGHAHETERLFIELLNEVNFRGGESQTVSIMVGRGKSQTALVGASIMIKVLGTNFRPLIFHTKTDSNGVAIVNLQLPQFSRGRAAVLFKAMSNGEEAELRRVIQPG